MKDRKSWVALIALILVIAMVIGLIVAVLPTPASAASSSEIKNQIDKLEGQKDSLQGQIDDLKAQQNTNATEIKDIVKQKNLIDQQTYSGEMFGFCGTTRPLAAHIGLLQRQ